jgi:hypothetical protein
MATPGVYVHVNNKSGLLHGDTIKAEFQFRGFCTQMKLQYCFWNTSVHFVWSFKLLLQAKLSPADVKCKMYRQSRGEALENLDRPNFVTGCLICPSQAAKTITITCITGYSQ